MRQASRRSWRIGQRQQVEVTYLVYEGTLEAEALALVAAKLRSSLMIEGELPEEGLAALDGDGQEVFLALARRLTEQRTDDAQSLEALFAQTRAIAVQADDYLVDGSWESDRQPRLVPTPAEHARHDKGDDRAQHNRPERAPIGAPAVRQVSSGTDGWLMDFQELARLVHRPKARPKSVPDVQLRLFDG